MSRCTGHCCKRFPLPYSVDELKEGVSRTTGMKLGRPGEAAVLADMLIPLGTSTYGDGEKSFLYTCRHHDTETGDCRIYETRPMMCSEYPYGNECAIEGCTAENKGVDPLTQIRLKADWRNLKPDRGGA